MTEPEQLIADLWATGITRDSYPTALIRNRLDSLGVTPPGPAAPACPTGPGSPSAGVVTHRQRPATARGITFINLEDEFGMINVICDPVVWQRHRLVARQSGGLLIRGMLERAGRRDQRVRRADRAARSRYPQPNPATSAEVFSGLPRTSR